MAQSVVLCNSSKSIPIKQHVRVPTENDDYVHAKIQDLRFGVECSENNNWRRLSLIPSSKAISFQHVRIPTENDDTSIKELKFPVQCTDDI
ncbi:hypothetical protein ACROYT_G028043 [Oculina patagonica]